VLRVLANLLGLPGFEFESSQDVLEQIAGIDNGHVAVAKLSNASDASIQLTTASPVAPAVASIYQLDGLLRRATSLQLTADARGVAVVDGTTEEVAA
jgi:NADH-quinone oxidoreductase subunit G